MSASPPSQLQRQVLSGLVWSIVRNWGAKLVSLLTFVVLARYVDPHDMGLIAAALAVLAFVEIFTEQGLGNAIVQRKEMSDGLLNSAFVVNLVSALVAVLIIVVFAHPIARLMDTEALVPVLQVVSMSVLLNALGFGQQAMCMRNFQYKWLALRSLVATTISGVSGLVMVMMGYGVWGLVTQAVLMAGINTLMLWIKPQWRPSWQFDFGGLRQMMGYSLKIFSGNVVNFGNTRFIEVFLAATLGPAALGVYAVGMRIHQTLTLLLNAAVLQVAHSGFSRLASDRPRLLSAYQEATSGSAAVAAPAFWITGLLAPELAEIVYGARWLDAAPLMLPMALLGAVQTVQFYNGSVLNAIGRPSYTLAINIAKLAATAISLLASRDAPLPVIIWSFVVGQLCVTPISFALARRGFRLPLLQTLRRLSPFLLGMVAMAVVAYGLRASGVIDDARAGVRLLVLGASMAAAYAIVVAALGREQMATILKRLRRQKKSKPPPPDADA